MPTVKVKYKLEFETGAKDEFDVEFDAESKTLKLKEDEARPDWTDLEHKQCSHCPLKKEESYSCPVALNLSRLVDHFKDSKSFWKTKVSVETDERTYSKETDLQSAIFSIFGLVMSTSDCPHMEFLKPMARFHLPFSTMDETMIRSTSMYLLKQYFLAKEGETPDIALKDLGALYDNVNKVNHGIVERIRSLGEGEAQSNAVIILDSFATMLSFELDCDLSSIRHYFFDEKEEG